MNRVEVKICGLCRPEDARAAEDFGAAYLGVVLSSSPRVQGPESASAIWSDRRARRAGVFVDQSPEEIVHLASALALDVVQLHGRESPEGCAEVRRAGPWAVWKAIKEQPHSGDLTAELDLYAAAADGVLVEGSSPKGHGGVGARADWERVAALRENWPAGLTLVLAGGLTPENVADAVRTVRPDIVDVSSGVEARLCEKDSSKVRAFIEAVRNVAAERS